ncbi:MAG TPA: TonB-dependent receptor [Blastocatellia bacterium]|nr:TonB-dependent receptor [Blastocatellia bacterium]
MRKLITAACIGTLLCCLSVVGSAQVHTASLTGLVTDPAGAVVASAQVKARNKATNVEWETTTDASGYYTFASLPIGTYTITVEAQGFKKSVRDNVILEVAQKARIDFALEVGAVAETVVVEASTPLLVTQEASPGKVVENRMVLDLPLSIRNWDDLLGLVAGVQGDRYTEEGGGTAAGRTGGVNVHGVRSLQNNFVLDGVDNNSISTNVQELTTQIARPSVDSIDEFKVTTNPYSAENGRSPGSLISVTTRSGSNVFHGTIYEFHRNRVFDANNFFLNRTGQKKGQHIQNQFGGNIGGPIVKDRAFFFFNYEGTRIRKGTTRLANVPLPNERRGDFSAAAAAANRTTYAQLIDRVGDCVGAGNPFPDNKIPERCLDPVAQRILSLVPLPNIVPATGPLNVNNYVRVPTIEDDTDSYTVRGDWHPNPRNTIFVRYTYSDRFRFVPGAFGGIIDGTSTSAFGRLFMKAHSAAIGWNRLIGSRAVNEFRIGWGRNDSTGVQDPFGLNTLAEFGIRGVPDNPIYSGGLPGINISGRGGTPTIGGTTSGTTRLGSPDFLPKFQKTNQFQWLDTVSLTYGAHQMKFGVDIRGPMRNIYLDVPGLRGTWNFDGQRTGIGLADFLLGYPSGAQLSNLAIVDARYKMFSWFFQDDWKVTPKLTLNLGLRYDFATWPYEGADRMTNLNLTTGQVFTPANSPFGRSLVKSDKNNYAPRLGIAYQIMPRMVLRTGYGRFFMLFERAGSEDQLGLNLPWLVNNVVAATTTNTTANNMRVRTGFNLSLDPSAVNPVTVRLRAVHPESVMPVVDQWNFGFQWLLPGDFVATVDYVGTKGTHLSVLRNLNQQFFNRDGTGTGIIPFPAFGPIEFRENMGNSIYHGGELTIERRFRQGFSFNLAYTFSKSIDQAMEHLFSGGSNSFMQNARDLRQQRGRSDFDYRHRFVVSYIYEIPLGKGKKYLTDGAASHILGGWRISGVTNLRSGRPFTVFASANNSLVGNRGGLANALADCLRDGTLPEDQRTVDRWFDITAYAVPTPARLGTCGRNTLDGPGLVNFDFALARSFDYFGENRRLEFRWEMFNLFNTPQFGLPGNNRSSGDVGRISSLAGDPRVMQFALKFYF